MPIRIFLLCLATLAIFSGCTTSEETSYPDSPDPWIGNLVAYKKVVSERHGIVGFVKVFEFKTEEFGDTYHLYKVLDIDLEERGLLYPRGEGMKFVNAAPEVAAVTGVTREEVELGPQPLELNLSLILEVDMPLRVYEAGPEDLQRPTAN